MEEMNIRKTLISHIATLKLATKGRIVEELGLCQGAGRIDVAVINGHFIGYEIKSERDTLKRLNSQIINYQKIFDKITLVTTERHAQKAVEAVPESWGILLAIKKRTGIHLKAIRRATYNDSIDPTALVQLLWRDEAADLLKRFGVTSGLSKMDRETLWRNVLEVVPSNELKMQVSNAIITRQYWRSGQQQT